ncbi:hypothetical protein ABQH43_03400 [Streptococcus sp. ZJ100]|uniref:hypothetical protein n=1 Tax=Streptococcus handemini TaxID=3161188 RepID=UPI0032EDF1DA
MTAQFEHKTEEHPRFSKNPGIIFVKIKDGSTLDRDESKVYTVQTRNDTNLKSRTLGDWRISQEKVYSIQYIVGVDSGSENNIISAYSVHSPEYHQFPDESRRVRFQTDESSADVLERLLKEYPTIKEELKTIPFHGPTRYY